jgi:Rod binding domain-containing protein
MKSCLHSATTTAPQQTNQVSNSDDPGKQVKLKQAARDFEAVFLRQMLSCLERTTKVSSNGNTIAGQGTYGSMVVDAVSESISKAGGLGIADVLAKAMEERLRTPSSSTTLVSSTDLGTKPIQSPTTSRPNVNSQPLAEDDRISSQGFAPTAVPRTEIRTSAFPVKGPLADRRIR